MISFSHLSSGQEWIEPVSMSRMGENDVGVDRGGWGKHGVATPPTRGTWPVLRGTRGQSRLFGKPRHDGRMGMEWDVPRLTANLLAQYSIALKSFHNVCYPIPSQAVGEGDICIPGGWYLGACLVLTYMQMYSWVRVLVTWKFTSNKAPLLNLQHIYTLHGNEKWKRLVNLFLLGSICILYVMFRYT